MLRKGNSVWLGLCVVIGLAGCHSTGLNQGNIPLSLPGMNKTQTSSSRMPVIRGRTDLPPQEAARVCYATAKELEKNKRYQGAITFYEKATKHDPSLNLSEKLAVLYDQQGKFEQAIREFRKALHASPNDASILNNMGYAYYSQGHWSEAEKIFREAVDAEPSHKRAWMNLGLTLGQQSRYMEALEAFTKGLNNEAQAYCNLGFVFMTQKKYEAAQTAYKRALELEPSLEIARKTLMVLRQKGVIPAAARSNVARPTKTVRAQSDDAKPAPPTVTKRQISVRVEANGDENVPSYVPVHERTGVTYLAR